MRSRTLIPAIVAVISLFALTPSAPSRTSIPSPSGRCIVSMQVAPRQIVAGDPVVIFGRLRCVNRASAAGQQVVLYHHLTGLPGFTPVQSATTDAHGFYEFGRADGVVETNRSFFVRSHGARSATKRIRVAAQVTLSGSAEGALLTGYPNRVTFTGAVSPADVGARVILQRQNALTGNQWRRIDSGIVESTGDFTITHTFVVPGDANLRVLVRSQGRNVPSESNVLADTVSQAQNPELTIQASADPISVGRSGHDQRQADRGRESLADADGPYRASTRFHPGGADDQQLRGRIQLPRAIAGQQHLLQGAMPASSYARRTRCVRLLHSGRSPRPSSTRASRMCSPLRPRRPRSKRARASRSRARSLPTKPATSSTSNARTHADPDSTWSSCRS